MDDLTAYGDSYYQNNQIQEITYNAFKAPVRIVDNNSTIIDFEYNVFQQRSHKKTTVNGIVTHTYYSADGSMEIKEDQNGNIEHSIYITGDPYSTPVIARKDQNGEKYLYLHRDYLGSIIGISNQAGQMIEKRAFDAWGGIMSIQDAQGNNLSTFAVLDRGYTGHEHLFEVGLIHMNARLYDPMLHRFLAPDNYVQDPYSTQNFNRYGYVLNNPLRYSDPSGEMPILVAALIGAAISVTVNGIANVSQGQNFFYNWGMAAFTGFIGGATANIIGNANLGVLQSTLAHAHLGTLMTSISGGNPLHGAISGALGSLIGAGTGKSLENTKSAWLAGGIMAVSGGIAGGFGSVIAGGSFWDGFRNGFISAGLNHAVHRFLQVDPLMQEAKRIAELYGGNAKDIYRFLKIHPLIVNNGKVFFKGIENAYVDINDSSQGIVSTEQVVETIIGQIAKFFIKGGGQLMKVQKLNNYPTQSNEMKLRVMMAEINLYEYMFAPVKSLDFNPEPYCAGYYYRYETYLYGYSRLYH